MSVEIPEELLHPTVEELKIRTANELLKKRRFSRRVGKDEREALKRQRNTAKLRAIAIEYDVPKRIDTVNNLSSLFVQKARPKFSLAAANAKPAFSAPCSPERPPTLKVAFEKVNKDGVTTSPIPLKPPARKRGRPPKVTSI